MTALASDAFPQEDSVERQGLIGTVRWNAVTRFAIRLWCVFFVIFVLPRSSQFLVYFNMWPPVVNAVGRWPITHIFGWPERSWASPMSGADYLPDFVAAAVLGSVSLMIAVVWSLADRRDSYLPRIFTWIYATQRYLLSALMLFYAWDKILPGQFGWGPNVEKVTLPVTQLTPMALLWAFMSVSRPYVVFTGVVEFIGGVLLLTRRTTCIGALISVAAMTNVFMLNLAYDVSVKFLSGQMLLMAVVLLAPYAKRLTQALLDQPPGSVPLPRLFTDMRRDRLARAAGVALAIAVVYWAHEKAQGIVDSGTAAARSSFDGVWSVDETRRNNVIVPPLVTDDTLWRRVIFVGEYTLHTHSMSDSETLYLPKIDRTNSRLDLLPVPPSPSSKPVASFRFHFIDDSHLELSSASDASINTVVRLRRVDPATWPVVTHRHRWTW